MTRTVHKTNELSTRALSKASHRPEMDEDDFADQAISDDGLGFEDLARQGSAESEASESSDESEGDPDKLMEEPSGNWGGLGGEIDDTRRKRSTTTSYNEIGHRAPTTKNIRIVKESEDLYSSNAFKLQVRV
jgi:hypothetical protein